MEQHWLEGLSVSFSGFQLLFGMLWSNHGEEHIQVLLRFTREQLTEHEQRRAQRLETEEYRLWMHQSREKGCRRFFRSIKIDEMPYKRPFQTKPRAERMQMRLAQWGAIWRIEQQPMQLLCMDELTQDGIEEARALPALTPESVWKTIRRLGNKAPGLDAIGFDMLKGLCFDAMQDLVHFFHAVEAGGTVPVQWQRNLIAMIPTSVDIETPIALVAKMYRLWCKLRWHVLKKWQGSLSIQMPW